MLSRVLCISFFVTLVLPFFAAATRTVTVTWTSAPIGPTGISGYDCAVTEEAHLLCCNSVQRADSTLASQLLAPNLLDVVVIPPDSLVGLTCSPLPIYYPYGAGQCSAQPVCCKDDSYNGIIAIGCLPVNLSW